MSTPKAIDVLVVGAGPVGLIASLFFSLRGYSVVLIEQLSCDKTKQRCFNERHQQVGLDPQSLNFLNKHFPDIYKEIIKASCPDSEWITISIKTLQNLLYSETKKIDNLQVIFNSQVESVTAPRSGDNARVIVVEDSDPGPSDDRIYAFYPELVVVCDGKHDGTGTAKRFFNFPSASRVTLSSSGIIGMIKRDTTDKTCLHNFSKDGFMTSIGPMHVRLLGSLQERYIALGSASGEVDKALNSLKPEEIEKLLIKTYNELKDEQEPYLEKFDEVSKKPISIILDYRKETIKLFEGSNTIVSVEGDAARKTTFFSGSGLNSAWKALDKLFSFCTKHSDLIFDNDNLLRIDEILLEKDQECLEISMELLRKGSKFLITPGCVKY